MHKNLMAATCCVYLWGLFYAAPVPAEESSGCSAALIESIDPAGATVGVRHADGAEVSVSKPEEEALDPGEELSTKESVVVDIRLCDGSAVRVGSNSRFRLESAEESAADWLFLLLEGSIRAIVVSSPDKQTVKFRVQTPTAAIGVRGTEFTAEYSGGTNQTNLYTMDGEVLMGDAKQIAELKQAARPEIFQKFRAVRKDTMSIMRQGMREPLPLRRFDRNTVFQRSIFRRSLERRELPQFRQKIQQIRERRQNLFQRTSPAIQKGLNMQREKTRLQEPKDVQKMLQQNLQQKMQQQPIKQRFQQQLQQQHAQPQNSRPQQMQRPQVPRPALPRPQSQRSPVPRPALPKPPMGGGRRR